MCGHLVGRSKLCILGHCVLNPLFLCLKGSALSFSLPPASKSHGGVVCLTQPLSLSQREHVRQESAQTGLEMELPGSVSYQLLGAAPGPTGGDGPR